MPAGFLVIFAVCALVFAILAARAAAHGHWWFFAFDMFGVLAYGGAALDAALLHYRISRRSGR